MTLAGAVVGLSCIMSLSGDLPDKLGIVNSPARGAAVLLVLIPLATVLFCAVLGALLAEIEGVRCGMRWELNRSCAPLGVRG